MSTKYQVLPPTAPVPAPDDVLERLVRAGARKMLQDALEAEVDDFLGRRRYQRTQDKRGHRNGHLPERSIGVGMGAVEIRLPRVSDVPPEVSPDGFHSEIVSRYQRRSRTQARLLARLLCISAKTNACFDSAELALGLTESHSGARVCWRPRWQWWSLIGRGEQNRSFFK